MQKLYNCISKIVKAIIETNVLCTFYCYFWYNCCRWKYGIDCFTYILFWGMAQN